MRSGIVLRMLRTLFLCTLLFASAAFAQSADKAYKFQRDGWTYVHLEGSPHDIGFQHGSLLAKEIADGFKSVQFQDVRRTKRPWTFYRDTAQKVLWPHIDDEYQQELKGIADGVRSKGVKLDVWDIVALNAFEEVPDYYVPWLDKQQHARKNPPRLTSPGNCSAFVATGSWTKDGKPVIAHNNWTNYANGERWRMVFDIQPEKGHHLIQDGYPGVIVSDDDFGINDSGIMVTETTITGFSGFDPNGKPEFMRARKALQYSESIDDYVRIMLEGNNGGYANDWLLADRKTGEVARFELGLKHHSVERTKDGYFVGSNFPSDPELIKDETDFKVNDPASSPNARHARWDQLMAENKGKIDVELAQKFEGDHYDAYEKRERADQRSLCGHVDVTKEGIPEWEWGPHYPGGTVQAKAADANMAEHLTFTARVGHGCGEKFEAQKFYAQHSEFGFLKPVLHDMDSGPWSTFKAGDRQ
jgi:hypothetical protein